MGRTLPVLFLLVAPCLAACGKPADPGRRLRLSSPLIERQPPVEGRESVLIQARGPCRLRLMSEGLGTETIREELTSRILPAGRSVGLYWSVLVHEAPPEMRGRPTEKDLERGRTEAHEVVVVFGFTDTGDQLARTVVWTRPGLERTIRYPIPPPARAEPVPFDSLFELALVLVADLDGTDLKFMVRGALTAVDAKGTKGGDMYLPIRLFLQVERP